MRARDGSRNVLLEADAKMPTPNAATGSGKEIVFIRVLSCRHPHPLSQLPLIFTTPSKTIPLGRTQDHSYFLSRQGTARIVLDAAANHPLLPHLAFCIINVFSIVAKPV